MEMCKYYFESVVQELTCQLSLKMNVTNGNILSEHQYDLVMYVPNFLVVFRVD